MQVLPEDEGWFLGIYNMSSESKTAVAAQTMCGRCKDKALPFPLSTFCWMAPFVPTWFEAFSFSLGIYAQKEVKGSPEFPANLKS